ncbi:MAG: hypothetical protein ACLVBJ_11820 [Pilosibacter sp.]
MENDRLLVLYPQKRGSEKERARLDEVLEAALDGIDAEIVENMDLLEQDPERYRGRRLLFAVPLGKNGINRGYYEVLAWLRGGEQVLSGAVGGMIIDAERNFTRKRRRGSWRSRRTVPAARLSDGRWWKNCLSTTI